MATPAMFIFGLGYVDVHLITRWRQQDGLFAAQSDSQGISTLNVTPVGNSSRLVTKRKCRTLRAPLMGAALPYPPLHQLPDMTRF